MESAIVEPFDISKLSVKHRIHLAIVWMAGSRGATNQQIGAHFKESSSATSNRSAKLASWGLITLTGRQVFGHTRQHIAHDHAKEIIPILREMTPFLESFETLEVPEEIAFNPGRLHRWPTDQYLRILLLLSKSKLNRYDIAAELDIPYRDLTKRVALLRDARLLTETEDRTLSTSPSGIAALVYFFEHSGRRLKAPLITIDDAFADEKARTEGLFDDFGPIKTSSLNFARVLVAAGPNGITVRDTSERLLVSEKAARVRLERLSDQKLAYAISIITSRGLFKLWNATPDLRVLVDKGQAALGPMVRMYGDRGKVEPSAPNRTEAMLGVKATMALLYLASQPMGLQLSVLARHIDIALNSDESARNQAFLWALSKAKLIEPTGTKWSPWEPTALGYDVAQNIAATYNAVTEHTQRLEASRARGMVIGQPHLSL